jgi:hypothetical protein
MTPLSISHATNSACPMRRTNTSALSGGWAGHQGSAASPRRLRPASTANPCSFSSPSPLSGAVATLCSTYRGSRRRPEALPDQAMAPTSRWPRTMHGSMGLMRGIRPSAMSLASQCAQRSTGPCLAGHARTQFQVGPVEHASCLNHVGDTTGHVDARICRERDVNLCVAGVAGCAGRSRRTRRCGRPGRPAVPVPGVREPAAAA